MATDTSDSIRPTKKQRELLSYIEQFIDEHGYSPSYREIMNGLNYTSVATVSLHVTSLIRRGHLRKRDRSARSLEVVQLPGVTPASPTADAPTAEVRWLVGKVEAVFTEAEGDTGSKPAGTAREDLGAVVKTLAVLGLSDIAATYQGRLDALNTRST